MPHRISKIVFALGADELLAMMEGKIREGPFLRFNLVKQQCGHYKVESSSKLVFKVHFQTKRYLILYLLIKYVYLLENI